MASKLTISEQYVEWEMGMNSVKGPNVDDVKSSEEATDWAERKAWMGWKQNDEQRIRGHAAAIVLDWLRYNAASFPKSLFAFTSEAAHILPVPLPSQSVPLGPKLHQLAEDTLHRGAQRDETSMEDLSSHRYLLDQSSTEAHGWEPVTSQRWSSKSPRCSRRSRASDNSPAATWSKSRSTRAAGSRECEEHGDDRYERMRDWNVTVQISGASHQKRAGGRAHVYYGIDVTVQFGDETSDCVSYTITRRFSRFLFLHLQLLREFPQLRLPHIEGGGWNIFRHQLSADFIAERMIHLQHYMSELIAHEEARLSESVFEFLELNSWQVLLEFKLL
ncbi:hypothetical protein GUITHDRAFT_164140 [Guillardia theta CCMP2712]|uniref:PX domain-containing protein n=1 Tax=Guillardia theta (strain CCMP2712) TaxID=905079 RepID=L1J1B6_GUITC|nr:hypothetical protein GUITHDRAFT_164140 [Guillardia theta CCMP2712]EKX42313.1 hypothetical protein GUITHDRAFT_164140 [Guillardia theta CCMP2712]|eukprot:XP_005829293.1 hypothetical protein GUITHDRAFT_164140 [Guillardia theta CCMP2712]